MIEAELADGRILEFPDDTAPEVVQETVENVLFPLRSIQKDFVSKQNKAAQELAQGLDPFADMLRAELSNITNDNSATPIPNRTEEIAKGTGVGTEGAPNSVRTSASFGDTPILGGDTLTPIKLALEKHFEKPVTVRKGEHTKEIEFSLDGENFTLFNKPGADLGDVSSAAGEAIVLGSDVIGSIGGAVVGSVATGGNPAGATTGSIFGSGVGTFIGEYTRQLIGKGLDVNDSDMGEILNDALAKSGIALSTTAGMAGLIKLGKGIINSITGKKFDMTPEELGLDNAQTKEVIDEVNNKIQQEFAPRAGQQGSDLLRLLDEQFAKNAPLGKTKKFEDIDTSNMSALEEFEARSTAQFKSSADDSLASGETVQKSINKNFTEPRQERIDNIVNSNINKADDIASDISKVDQQEIGQTIRDVAEKEQEALKNAFKGRFDEFNTSKFKSDGVDLKDISKTIKSESDKSLIPSLTASDKKLASEIESSLTKETKVVDFLKNIDKTIKEGKKVNLGQIQATLRAVNKKIRSLEKGLTSDDTSIASLKRIKGKLKSERQLMLKDEPDVLNRIEGLENELRIAKDKVDRSIIGDIMKVNKGRFAIKDQDIFKRVIAPGKLEESKRLAEAVQDNPEAKDAIRKGILDLYKSKVFIKDNPLDGNIKIPDKKAHDKFIKDYKDVIEPFLTKREIDTIDGAGAMSKLLDKQLKQRTSLIGKMDKLFSSKIQRLEPEVIAKHIMDGDLTGRSFRLRKLLETDPEALKTIQGEVTKRVRNLITKDGKFSFKALDDILNSSNKINLGVIVNPKYVDDLVTLRNALKLVQKQSGLSGGTNQSHDATSKVVGGLFRGLFAPPLSRRGRIFTAAQAGQSTAALRALGDALESPEKLKAIVSAMKLKGSTKRVAEILSSVGMLHLTFPDQP